MKKLFLINYFISIAIYASAVNGLNAFQELCAKEKNPVYRENYCLMMSKNNHLSFNKENLPHINLTA